MITFRKKEDGTVVIVTEQEQEVSIEQLLALNESDVRAIDAFKAQIEQRNITIQKLKEFLNNKRKK